MHVSHLVSYRIAKSGKAHKIERRLVLPAIKDAEVKDSAAPIGKHLISNLLFSFVLPTTSKNNE